MGKTTGQRFASVWDALPHGLRDATESTCEPLSGAKGTDAHENAGNATKVILLADSIATINWTGIAENATRGRDTETVKQSNE